MKKREKRQERKEKRKRREKREKKKEKGRKGEKKVSWVNFYQSPFNSQKKIFILARSLNISYHCMISNPVKSFFSGTITLYYLITLDTLLLPSRVGHKTWRLGQPTQKALRKHGDLKFSRRLDQRQIYLVELSLMMLPHCI